MCNIIVLNNPLTGTYDHQSTYVDKPNRIADYAPSAPGVFVCQVNGMYVLRKDWDQKLKNGDTVIFTYVPQGGVGRSIVRGIRSAIRTIGRALSGRSGGSRGTGIASNSLVSEADSAAEKYSIAARGNVARLGEPIPVVYGTFKVTPDYIAVPFISFTGGPDNISGNQYEISYKGEYIERLHAFYLISQGECDVTDIRFGETRADQLDGVKVEIFKPGELPGDLFCGSKAPTMRVVSELANVNPEADGDNVVAALCPPGMRISRFSVDVETPDGIYLVYEDRKNGQTRGADTVEIEVYCQEIDDFGNPVGRERKFDSIRITDSVPVPRKLTYSYETFKGRHQVRLKRITPKRTPRFGANNVIIRQVRAKVVNAQFDPSECTWARVEIRAGAAINASNIGEFSCVASRHLFDFNENGMLVTSRPTSSMVAAFVDVLTNPVYGLNLPTSQINFPELLQLRERLAIIEVQFNGVFAQSETAWDALNTIARVGRCVPIIENGKVTMIRDELKPFPVAMFNPFNIVRGTFQIETQPVSSVTTNKFVFTYIDENDWREKEIIASSGFTGNENIERIELKGITKREVAELEAAFYAAQNKLVRKSITFETELEGFIPRYGDLIAVSHDIVQWGQSGEVIALEGDLIELSDPVEFVDFIDNDRNKAPSKHVLAATTSSGVSEQITVVATESRFVVRAVTAIPADLLPGSLYTFGPAESFYRECKVTSLTPVGSDRIRISSSIENPDVYNIVSGDGLVEYTDFLLQGNDKPSVYAEEGCDNDSFRDGQLVADPDDPSNSYPVTPPEVIGGPPEYGPPPSVPPQPERPEDPPPPDPSEEEDDCFFNCDEEEDEPIEEEPEEETGTGGGDTGRITDEEGGVAGMNVVLSRTNPAITENMPEGFTKEVKIKLLRGQIGSTSVTAPALRVGRVGRGVTVIYENYGTIVGKGGDGGQPASKGGDGGIALLIDAGPFYFYNYGVLAGGGGGGAGGSTIRTQERDPETGAIQYEYHPGGGGGGGAGLIPGASGGGGSGGSNSIEGGGSGGDGQFDVPPPKGGTNSGGNGGGYGQDGGPSRAVDGGSKFVGGKRGFFNIAIEGVVFAIRGSGGVVRGRSRKVKSEAEIAELYR